MRQRGWHTAFSLALVLALLVGGMGQLAFPHPTRAARASERGLQPTPYLPLAGDRCGAISKRSAEVFSANPATRPTILSPHLACTPTTNWLLPHYDLGNTRAKLDEVMQAITPTVLWEKTLSPDFLGGWTHGDGAWCQDIAADATSVYYAVWHRSEEESEPNYSF